MFPDDFASSTLGITKDVVTLLNQPLTLIIGVLLAVVAVSLLIRVLTHH